MIPRAKKEGKELKNKTSKRHTTSTAYIGRFERTENIATSVISQAFTPNRPRVALSVGYIF